MTTLTFKTATTLAAATLGMTLAGPLAAQDVDPALDTNADGLISYSEMITGFPELTEEGFMQMDTSGDGVLDATEIADAVAAGLIAPADG